MSSRTRASSAGGGMRYALYLYDIFDGYATANTTFPADVISFVLIQIKETVTLDRLISICFANAAGNQRMALYQDNGFVPDGGGLIVETGSVAVALGKNELPIANTRLAPGLYWLAQNRDNGGPTWLTYQGAPAPAGVAIGGTVQGRFVALAYGAFPAVCPVTAITDVPLCQWVRVASIP